MEYNNILLSAYQSEYKKNHYNVYTMQTIFLKQLSLTTRIYAESLAKLFLALFMSCIAICPSQW